MDSKKYRGQPNTTCIKEMIADAGLANFKELKRLAANRESEKLREVVKPNLRLIVQKNGSF